MNVQEQTAQKATSERVLDAAEALFARQGFRATSLREITDLADVNIAAVNYHFRSKEALLRAVYERSFLPLNEHRLALLTAAESAAAGEPPSLESILDAFFRPMMEAWEVNPNFILLVGRLQHEPDPELNGFIRGLYAEVIPRFLAAARRAQPDIAENDLFFWIHFLFGGVVFNLLNSEDMQRLHRAQSRFDVPEVFLHRLIAFGASGLRALAKPDRAAGPKRRRGS